MTKKSVFQKNNRDVNFNSDFITFRNSHSDIFQSAFKQNNEDFSRTLNISELILAPQNCNRKDSGPDNNPY